MKRIICVLLSLVILFGASACSGGRKAQPSKDKEKQEQGDKEGKKEKMDAKQGQAVVEGYMRALILRDTNRIKNYYSSGLKQQVTGLTPAENPHPNGYKVDTLEDKEGKLEGKASIFSITTGQPYFSSDESKITVIKEKGVYLIDKIEKSKNVEVAAEDGRLVIKEDGDVKGKEIIRLTELPQFATPQGASPDQKFAVARERFGPIALDPEGKKLALSTYGANPAIMIVETEKKKVKPLDIYFEGSIQSIAWSQDGKFLAVEMSNKGGSRFLNVYDVEKEQMVDDPMKNALIPEKYTINSPYWMSESELIFNASGVGKLTADEQKKTGTYKFDVKNVNLTKF